MTLALQIILVITSVLMTVFVLLHKGKGGGLSSLFGGGVQSNLSGSTVVEKNLDRYTVVMGIIWITCIIALNLLQAFGA
ncbi:preprotein translocase subunit SecG [Corynebacterium alimapuense]|uniref:Protein-export membrane protein SecG n=1 Tax=Corynebacterium alimapuense TaxID=1576874 RepID=A0A3M8K7J4_9CORY|nr:preprotein translocase subunit SecG [Corynebacterium alimapuense]RNE49197.1 preprotein translocase subunit SecG [Corynebacterium alimapuense]